MAVALRVIPAMVAKMARVGMGSVEPLPMSQLDDLEAADNELSSFIEAFGPRPY